MDISEPGEARRATQPPFQANGSRPPEAPENQAGSEGDLMSVIGADILVTGDIEAQVDLHIEGRVQGDVRCATLILGERSSVVGSVFAQRVRVAGSVEGGIETCDLAIESTARVKGDVTYSRLRIANGGIIQGTMTHKPVDEASEAAKSELVAEEAPAPAKVHFIE